MNRIPTPILMIAVVLGLGASGCNDPSSAAAPLTVASTGPTASGAAAAPTGPVCGCGGDCTSSAGDGIPDNWKTIGVDSDCDGKIDLNLGAMGADTRHKDVFLWIDYMSLPANLDGGDATASLKPTDGAIQRLVKAFDDAPVLNPDGTTGIHLHVVVGNEVPFHAVVTLDGSIGAPCAGNDFAYLGDIKAKSLDAAHALIFHYALSAFDSTTPNDGTLVASCPADPVCGGHPTAGSTGISQIGGTDFIVSLGSWLQVGNANAPDDPKPFNHDFLDLVESATIMHELGHNFGLMHGGLASPGDKDQECNPYKPNYLSVMNYNYQSVGGIPSHSGGDVDFYGNHLILDYSRAQLPTLNEGALDEAAGAGSTDPNLMILFQDMAGDTFLGESSGPVDWNQNGSFDAAPEFADIDHSGGNSGLLVGGEDWSHLDYGFYSNTNPPQLATRNARVLRATPRARSAVMTAE